MKKAAIFCKFGPDDHDLNRILGPRLRNRIRARSHLLPEVVTPENFGYLTPELRDIEVIFATWGMWKLQAAQLDALPNLKAVFYAAGSVKPFAVPLLERGVTVTSAWGANAVPVAEFALSQILLANKGYFRNVQEFAVTPKYEVFRGDGNYGQRVALLGAGQIGRKLIQLLKPFALRVSVFDPFLSNKGAEALGVEKLESMDEAFSSAGVVSNHLADVEDTVRLIRAEHLRMLPPNATFINTARGRIVDHEGLLRVLRERPDVTALLDVTDPEPLPLAHPLWALPNVRISGHIAGSIGDELERLGEYAMDEFERWLREEPLRYAVTLPMLETLA